MGGEGGEGRGRCVCRPDDRDEARGPAADDDGMAFDQLAAIRHGVPHHDALGLVRRAARLVRVGHVAEKALLCV